MATTTASLGAIFVGLANGLEGTASAGGGLATLGAAFWVVYQFNINEQNRLSASNMEAALAGFETGLLELQREASRVNWIMAARTFAIALEAKRGILNAEHQRAFAAKFESIRIQISRQIRNRPIEFFFCVDDDPENPLPEDGTDRAMEAAQRSWVETRYSHLHGHRSELESVEHSLKALWWIYEACAHPSNYIDPLDSDLPRRTVGFDHGFQGLRDFIRFNELYSCYPDRTIRRRNTNEIVRDAPAN